MHHSIRFERACTAPPEAVYDVLIDVERWPEWLSGARSAGWEKPDDSGTRVGAVRRIAVSGLTMREEILVDDGPHHHAYRIVSGIPVTGHRADVHIHEQAGGSLIVWRATFRSRIALAGPVLWLLLRASMPRMAADLARAAERRAT
jgi:carbon monoxide dehydrogenase subunit G